MNTNQGIQKADGSYTVEVEVIDNSGKKEAYSTTVYKDVKKPKIVNFEFSAKGHREGKGLPVKMEGYGYYFTRNTEVIITARDASPASGVRTIAYYLEDYKSGKVKKTRIKRLKVDSKNQVKIKIPKNFKGQLYAKAEDKVGNTPQKFVKPEGAILESASKHKATSSIILTKETSQKRDLNGLDLYRTDVRVDLEVADTFSGIRSIEWGVSSPYDTKNNWSKSLTVDNNGKISGDKGGWKKQETDVNLVTAMSRSITVSNNSNDIRVWVKMTDRAGNSSQKEIQFSIDKTAPVITIAYDNNNPDAGFVNTGYYKDMRTATITVMERNFNGADVQVRINNTLGVNPVLSSWSTEKDSLNPDQTVHRATIAFREDGDYLWSLDYTDLAGNEGSAAAEQRFTIDRTVPTITVTYDNQNSQNSNYYREERKATITIKERNFETSRVRIGITAADQGKQIEAPNVNGWSSNGELHTATISFDKDAEYSLKVEYLDKAGNAAAPYDEGKFYIDKTLPEIKVTGIKNKSANNGKQEEGKIGFVIEARDTNFGSLDPKMELITNSKTETYKEIDKTSENIENGIRYTIDNLEADGIYRLKISATDKAGNRQTKAIVLNGKGKEKKVGEMLFSVNRKGSVYTLDEKTKKLNGGYTDTSTDVNILETNVDEIRNVKLTLFRDTGTYVLKEGQDYTIEKAGKKGEWKQYKYHIRKDNFEEDGEYSISVYSEDKAKNKSENTMDTKNTALRFVVDKTKPNIIVTNLKDKTTYSEESREVTIVANDNIKLQNLKIYQAAYSRSADQMDYGNPVAEWDEEEIEKMAAENQDFTFTIPGDSVQKHKIKVVATDCAGCERVEEVKDFYVTTNWWINFRTNYLMFYGCIGILVLILVGGVRFASKKVKSAA